MQDGKESGIVHIGVDEKCAYLRELKIGERTYSGWYTLFAGVASNNPTDVEEYQTTHRTRFNRLTLLEMLGDNGRRIKFLVAGNRNLRDWWDRNCNCPAPLVVRATPHLLKPLFNGNGRPLIRLYYDGCWIFPQEVFFKIYRDYWGRNGVSRKSKILSKTKKKE